MVVDEREMYGQDLEYTARQLRRRALKMQRIVAELISMIKPSRAVMSLYYEAQREVWKDIPELPRKPR